MNVIEFIERVPEAAAGLSSPLVDISVDGRPLREIMKDVELPMARREGHPDIAGGYAGIEVPDSPQAYYLGREAMSWPGDSRKTVLLECNCGFPGCWPLLCEIVETDSEVRWLGFAQPHRGPESATGFWDYSGFGGFLFDKQQYLEALEALRSTV